MGMMQIGLKFIIVCLTWHQARQTIQCKPTNTLWDLGEDQAATKDKQIKQNSSKHFRAISNKQKISYKRYIYGKAGREGYMRISEGNWKKTQKIFWKFAQKYRWNLIRNTFKIKQYSTQSLIGCIHRRAVQITREMFGRNSKYRWFNIIYLFMQQQSCLFGLELITEQGVS